MSDMDLLMGEIPVYLFSYEEKDTHCLSPIVDALGDYFSSVRIVSCDDLGDDMARFSADICPVGVFSSVLAYDFAKFIRAGRPFISIGLEHGVAPFKAYTYNDRFIEYDRYISPTKMWADRLSGLHPRYADKFLTVSYPRMNDLQERVEKYRHSVHEAWSGAPIGSRDLVILSWGIDFSALKQMPDREGIVYLVHPAMFRAVGRAKLDLARVIVSDPDVAASLIASAGRIFGDFSSMTLEAACLNANTFMFLDRRFYDSNCDLSPEFFDHGAPGFGKVESAGFSLPREHILDLQGLAGVLGGDAIAETAAVASWAPSAMMPEVTHDQSARAATAIAEVVSALWPQKRLSGMMSPSFMALKAVDSAYRDVLGRKPDYPAAITHAKNWLDSSAPAPAKTIGLYNTFAQSAEGQRRWGAGNFFAPKIVIEAMQGSTSKIS